MLITGAIGLLNDVFIKAEAVLRMILKLLYHYGTAIYA